MKRRTFLTGLGTIVAAPLVLKACGGDDGSVTTSGGPTTGGDGDSEPGFRIVNADANDTGSHPHSFVILCSDEDMAEVTYTAGESGHTHQVTLSSDDLAMIFSGGSVTIETTDGGHPHTWDIVMPETGCEEPAEPPPTTTTTDGGW